MLEFVLIRVRELKHYSVAQFESRFYLTSDEGFVCVHGFTHDS